MRKAIVEIEMTGTLVSHNVRDAFGKLIQSFPVNTDNPARAENDAQMCAHFYRMSSAVTPKSLHLRKVSSPGTRPVFMGRPYYGVEIELFQKDNGTWRIDGDVDGIEISEEHKTRKAALQAIVEIGADDVDTYNCLNPKGGTFKISRSQKGGCCDPATETYHSM